MLLPQDDTRYNEFNEQYPQMMILTEYVKKPERAVVGREYEMQQAAAAMARPELCNIILIGEAGSGKTTLVQGLSLHDEERTYLEVKLHSLKDPHIMAAALTELFNEVVKYRINEEKELVLFIDEFHLIQQISPVAIEALKPLLADSGTRGIRIIAATTFLEFQEYISPNLPLVERLQRITISQPGEEVVISILKNMAQRYDVDHLFYNDHLFRLIYQYTNRYQPSSSQPRKSIKILDDMIGWHRAFKRPLNKQLLHDVIENQTGIKVDIEVDATKIKEYLDSKVLSQQYASLAIENQLSKCVAGLNDKTKPMASFLFTGSTGVGKTEMTKQLAQILFHNDRQLIRFDMTEYSNEDSLERFKIELTSKVQNWPYAIILFDEIEKANAKITKILMQVLDDGRLSDVNNRETTFLNSYIVMTTNAGSEVYRQISQYEAGNGDKGLEQYEKLILQSISSFPNFPVELIARIDSIVPFQPLSLKTQQKILLMKLRKLRKTVKEVTPYGTELLVDERVIPYLTYDMLDTNSDSGGVREIVKKMDSTLTTKVAKYIVKYPDEPCIAAVVEGEMAYDNKNRRESDARIVVKSTTAEHCMRNGYNLLNLRTDRL